MAVQVLDTMARGGFEQVLAVHDRLSGLRAFLAIHDTTLGPAFGGIRRWAYRDEEGALRDCLRLSRAMTQKCALIGLPGGGGKMVVLDRPDLDLQAAYRHIGGVVEGLGGRWYTGPDVGTGPDELGWLAETTGFVTRPGPEGPGELGEATARGVVAGMGAALRALDGAEDWERRTVVIQGLGDVGERVCRQLLELGVGVRAAEIEPDRADRMSAELGIEMIPPSREYDPPCDIFAPCALGGILHDLTLPRLGCRIVAGAANNLLARPEHGDRLHERGILYVPDIAINSGALIRGATFHLTDERPPMPEIEARVGTAVGEILDRALAEGLPPARVALRMADERIQEARENAFGGAAFRPSKDASGSEDPDAGEDENPGRRD